MTVDDAQQESGSATPLTSPTPAGGRSGRRAGPARQGTLREHNLRLVLGHVFDATEPPSRADIAAATHLTRGTVSALVDQLVQSGLVAELAPVAVRRAGRPAVPLVPARRTTSHSVICNAMPPCISVAERLSLASSIRARVCTNQ